MRRTVIAALFAAAQLTPEQHDAYRIALMSALTWHSFPSDSDLTEVMPNGMLAEHQAQRQAFVRTHLPVSPTSVQGKNLAFVAAHPDELKALLWTGIWTTP